MLNQNALKALGNAFARICNFWPTIAAPAQRAVESGRGDAQVHAVLGQFASDFARTLWQLPDSRLHYPACKRLAGSSDPVLNGLGRVALALSCQLGGTNVTNVLEAVYREAQNANVIVSRAYQNAPSASPVTTPPTRPHLSEALSQMVSPTISAPPAYKPPPPPPASPPAPPASIVPQSVSSQDSTITPFAWSLAKRAIAGDPTVLKQLREIENNSNAGDRWSQDLDGQIQRAARILNAQSGNVSQFSGEDDLMSPDPTLVEKLAQGMASADPAFNSIVAMLSDGVEQQDPTVTALAQAVYARGREILSTEPAAADALMDKVMGLVAQLPETTVPIKAKRLAEPAIMPSSGPHSLDVADPPEFAGDAMSDLENLAAMILQGNNQDHPAMPELLQTLLLGVDAGHPTLTALAEQIVRQGGSGLFGGSGLPQGSITSPGGCF